MVEIQPVDNGYFYYLYQNHKISDIRIVYAPPKNIGFYGGDADNFEWTRHDGDFTFMRAYVAPDGKSAEYSASNVPYKPKKYLTLNIGPKKEGDFVFVLGVSRRDDAISRKPKRRVCTGRQFPFYR